MHLEVQIFKIWMAKDGRVAHTCHLSTQEAEPGELQWVWGSLDYTVSSRPA